MGMKKIIEDWWYSFYMYSKQQNNMYRSTPRYGAAFLSTWFISMLVISILGISNLLGTIISKPFNGFRVTRITMLIILISSIAIIMQCFNKERTDRIVKSHQYEDELSNKRRLKNVTIALVVSTIIMLASTALMLFAGKAQTKEGSVTSAVYYFPKLDNNIY